MDAEDLRKKLIHLTKKSVKEKYASSEAHIIKVTSLIESLDGAINLLTEQLREWHAVHFPELNQLVKSNDTFVELVVKLTERKNFDTINVMGMVQDTILAEKIIESAKDSAGEDTGKNELNEIKSLAEKIFELKKERKQLTEFIEKTMKEKWPHVSAITGAMLGAKMIARIGSAKKFAFAPSSTVQLIGAEKALFLHMKKGTRTPKYGYLFTHPEILNARYKEKGKLARKMAGKISIAAKQDFFARKNAREIIEKDTAMEKDFKEKRKEKNRQYEERKKEFERGGEKETDSKDGPEEKKPYEFRKPFDRDKPQGEFHKERQGFQKPFNRDSETQKPFNRDSGFQKENKGFQKPFKRDSEPQKQFNKEPEFKNSNENKGFQKPFNKRREFQSQTEEETGYRPFNQGTGFQRPFNRGQKFHGKPKFGKFNKGGKFRKFGKKKWGN